MQILSVSMGHPILRHRLGLVALLRREPMIMNINEVQVPVSQGKRHLFCRALDHSFLIFRYTTKFQMARSLNTFLKQVLLLAFKTGIWTFCILNLTFLQLRCVMFGVLDTCQVKCRKLITQICHNSLLIITHLYSTWLIKGKMPINGDKKSFLNPHGD